MRLAVLASLLLVGCQLNAFDSTITGESTVAGVSSVAPLSAIPPFGAFSAIDFAHNADFKAEGVTKDDLNLAKVTRLTLKIESPSDQDFSFLDDVSFFARSGDQRVLVARKSDVSGEGLHAPNPTLELDTTGADLTPYVTAPTMSLEVEAHGRAPPKDVKLEASVQFEFRVKVF
jgi:hypothetical protein